MKINIPPKFMLLVLFLLILGLAFYGFRICRAGLRCYTSPGSPVSEICDKSIKNLDCSSVHMSPREEPKFDASSNQWCQVCWGAAPSTCFNKYPFCPPPNILKNFLKKN